MHKSYKVELLAPAGGPAALHAAACAGADAVYLGLESFNARRGAENFTLETLREACDYAHLRGMNVYVAFNTLVLPKEYGGALECARQAYRAGADAFIVQDVGIASELSRTLPEARLHISTQMNTHNAAGIEAAARLGAKRVTLARELSIPEIAELSDVARDLGLEVEVFAHGALCVCYSGQCLMSSMIGGRSANRGTCAQACRLPYTLKNRAISKDLPSAGDHLLSPKDLCSIDLLPQLVGAGVSSLKIEGRMKSPEYVFAAVSAYRATLDEVLSGNDSPQTKERKNALAETFSRGFTTAYLEGKRGNDIMSYQRPNNRGASVGRIARVTETAALLDATCEIVAGDILEIWTGKGHTGHTLSEIETDRKGCVRIPLDKKSRDDRAVRAGDRVFRVRSAAAAFDDSPLEPRVAVGGSVKLKIGEPLEIAFWPIGEDGQARFDAMGLATGAQVEPARTKAITEQEVREHVDRLGQTPFSLESLSVELDEGAGLGFSQLHKVRAEALSDLEETMLLAYRDRKLPRIETRVQPSIVAQPRCQVVAWATNPVCARTAKRAGAAELFVPALNFRRGEAVVAGQRTSTVETAGYPKQSIVAMPTIDHDPVSGTREASLAFDPWEYAKPDKAVFVDSMAGVVRALSVGASVEVGPHVPVTNRLALDYLAGLGVSRVWLSPELTLAQIEQLCQGGTPVPVGITLIGATELMITEHCLLMSQGPCEEHCDECPRRKSPHYLLDRKGFEFPVITDCLGRSHLYNSVSLDIAHAAPDLIAAGISAFMVDTTLMNGEQAAQAVGRAVRARDIAERDGNEVAKVGGTTSGHLFRGVS